MPDRTDQPTSEPSSRARENVIMSEPATIERCAKDYQSGATVRAHIDRNVRNEVRRLGRR